MGQDSPCPKCNTPLEPVVNRDVPFLGCETCFGLWATEGDLAVYVERASTPESAMKFAILLEKAVSHPAGGKHARRHCPLCAVPLARIGFGENPFVILDRCDAHGLWLDRSELKQVVSSSRFAAHGHSDDATLPHESAPTEENAPEPQPGP